MRRSQPLLQILLTPFQRFARSESAGGLVLIFTAIVAFAWANSPWVTSYERMRTFPLAIQAGPWQLAGTLEFWVNDGLMAVFFLLVGLEIKREVLAGELAGLRRALWPAVAAVGGMVVPAAIYAGVNWEGEGLRGWGIPMATDIAFALGAISLLGERVPVSLKVFLTALAIVDDLGAVLVIAVFYTEELHLAALAIALGIAGACWVYGRLGGRRLVVFCVLGLVLWHFMHESGVHATVAGVLLALTIPIRAAIPRMPRAQPAPGTTGSEEAEMQMEAEEDELGRVRSPLHRLEHALTPWVAFLIMPAFALLNAGVTAPGGGVAVTSLSIGILLGLLVGKPIGIVGASWMADRLGLISLPADVRWPAMVGVGILGGIGFTMSLFIAMLAFAHSPALLDQAKLGVLVTSVVAAGIGLAVLAWTTGKKVGRPVEAGEPDGR